VTPAAIDVSGLSFAIDGKRILENVSFRVDRGAFWSIIGRNGAGKSTLLKCLERIERRWQGRIRIQGEPIETLPQKELARRISYVPQAGEGLFPFTVREFVLMSRYPHLSPFTTVHAEDERTADRALETTGTTMFARRRLPTLSGGERQKVYIAAALAQGAPIMLLDEPTTFLDYRHQVEVLGLLRRIGADGTTILSVTHDVNCALQTSDHILALDKGRVVFEGPAREVADLAMLERIYHASFRALDDPATDMPLFLAREDRP
jgi:iron complex transport system ATP-binding protein